MLRHCFNKGATVLIFGVQPVLLNLAPSLFQRLRVEPYYIMWELPDSDHPHALLWLKKGTVISITSEV